jgi:tetratricopeptide (TPR) repeat protein
MAVAGCRLNPTSEALAVLALVGLAVWAAHAGALQGEFHYDDVFAIVENPAVHSWQPLRYFTTADAVISEAHAAGYRPLTVATFALNYRIGGLDPFGYLLTNWLLHLAASWLVFLVGRDLLGDARWAALAALVFALHPVNAEAVNYATARSSLLATVGALASFGAFLRRVERGGFGWLVLSLAAFAVALLSKESAVALLAPLIAYPWIRRRLAERTGRPHGGYGIVVPYVILAVAFVAGWRSMTAGGIAPPGAAPYPAWVFAELVLRSLILWVWPWPLGLDHPLALLTWFDSTLAVLLVVALVGILAAVVVAVWHAPFAAWVAVWVAAGLSPLLPLPWLTTVGLLQEHRLGFSAVGLAWLTAAGARALIASLQRTPRGVWLMRWIVMPIGVVIAVAAVSIDRARSAVWNDDRLVWEEVVRRSPEYLIARINLGSAYMAHKEFDRAEAIFRGVTAIAPRYPRAYYNLGLLALSRARYEDAQESFPPTTEDTPGDTEGHQVLGLEAARRQRFAAAAAAFQHVIALQPTDAKAHTQMGLIALRMGDDRSAEASYLTVLRYDPTNQDALNNLGNIFLQRREWARALEYLTAALQRDPQFLEAAYNRAVALVGLGRREEAYPILRDVESRLPREAKFEPYRVGITHLLAGGDP